MKCTKDTALLFHDLGYPVVLVPVGEKGPRDRVWQDIRYTREELEERFDNCPMLNVGIILGPASGIIDLEGDDPESPARFEELFADCEQPATPCYQARRGIHRLYEYDPRLEEIGKAEFKFNKLEIRLGAGGKAAQSLLPPSATDGFTRDWIVPLTAECRPAKLPDLVIERILAAARSAAKEKSAKKDRSAKETKAGQKADKAGDDFCARADWHEILEPHGWTCLGESEGEAKWRRPDKDGGSLSATTGHCTSEEGRDLFYVFSNNAPPFEEGRGYNKFAVYTLLNHAGDFSAAAAALAEKGYGKKTQPSASTRLIRLVENAHLFHTPGGDPYATVLVDGHNETYPIESKAFKRYLEHQFYKKTRKAASSKALTEALGLIAARAIFEGDETEIHTRLAGVKDAIYLDLGTPKWDAIEITPQGWDVVDNPPVKFRRPNGLLRLPYPQHGGCIDELRAFVNVDDDSWPMLVSGLVAAVRPNGPYPILAFTSEHGSCKSTSMRVVRQVIDPNKADVRGTPSNVEGLMLAANNAWFLAWDNVSGLPGWLSDALCRVATGGGLGTRALYTNDEEKLFDAQRPIMVTGITDLTDREDFLDRCLIIRCPQMSEEDRMDEYEFYARYEKMRPLILGSVLTAASAALDNFPTTKLERLPRMADFARWGAAAETGLGWEPGTFMNAYDANRTEASEIALDNPLANATIAMGKEEKKWSGSASDLLTCLNEKFSTERMRNDDAWPKGANALSRKLDRMKADLRKAGVLVSRHRRTIDVLCTSA